MERRAPYHAVVHRFFKVSPPQCNLLISDESNYVLFVFIREAKHTCSFNALWIFLLKAVPALYSR